MEVTLKEQGKRTGMIALDGHGMLDATVTWEGIFE
jgi:hypothetical protein